MNQSNIIVLLFLSWGLIASCSGDAADQVGAPDQVDAVAQVDAAEQIDAVELSSVAPLQNDLPEDEAPLDDVWPKMSEPLFGDLDEMLARGEIRILTTFTLGAYFIDKGEQRGLNYEMSRLLETFVREKFGKQAKTLKVTIIPVRRDQLLPFLIAGHGDAVLANLTITPERSKIVDFSRPFTSKARELLVTGPGAAEISSLTDLAGKEIVVPAASSYFESLQSVNNQFATDGLAPIRITESDPRLEIEDILEMMNAGLLPMTIADEHRTHVWAKVFENLTVHEDIAFRENGSIAIALRKNGPQFKQMLDEFVRENRVGTLTANILINKYSRNTGWARPALAREPFRRFEQLAALFQTYGDQYEFDWLLLASFAFQESAFDQDARSPVGAIGVMQVMPSTAADRSVNIADIHVLENNVHAGTKYLALLRGHYFADEEIEHTERMLFTMAGYNAGPNRINRLRRVAATRGLDPNIWFNNVELVVAAQVGREPVDYVGNIYRYYIAYKRAMEEVESDGLADEALDKTL